MQDSKQIIFYKSQTGNIKINVFLKDETLWLSKKMMAELFGVQENNITYHIKEIYNSCKLDNNSTTQKIGVVEKEGNREVKRNIDFYNLDMIIAVGYRVNSLQATQFRIWATNILKINEFGHYQPHAFLPIGAKVKLNASNKSIEIIDDFLN